MVKNTKNAISPTRGENYNEWYQQVIVAADLAENSAVRGCMVIKPWGFALWENIQRDLDRRFKETDHENAYFPLFIPLGFFEKEAEHVEGFAKECAVITHHRLEENGEGGLDPAGKLEEPLVVRPTSETIIGASFAKWVNSYRDLPLLINQWANVVRWEMRPRVFLRTAEFLWQEGHTCHATEQEAIDETLQMLNVYKDFAEEFMAIPVIHGEKTPTERFPGAVSTYSIEAMMQDGKALQAGTSHFLGQNFAKASEIKYLSDENKEEYVWTTSWGVSTRLIGALIMTHSDDDGLRLPPTIAPQQVVIVPVIPKPEMADKVMPYVEEVAAELKKLRFREERLRVKIDKSDKRGGEKTWHWVKKGVPIRLEIGPRDVDENKVCLTRRDKAPKDKSFLTREEAIGNLVDVLEDIQNNLYQQALATQKAHTKNIDSEDELKEFFNTTSDQGIQGGFAMVHWCGSEACETAYKDSLKLTIRNIPINQKTEKGACICCGKDSNRRVILSKAY